MNTNNKKKTSWRGAETFIGLPECFENEGSSEISTNLRRRPDVTISCNLPLLRDFMSWGSFTQNKGERRIQDTTRTRGRPRGIRAGQIASEENNFDARTNTVKILARTVVAGQKGDLPQDTDRLSIKCDRKKNEEYC